MTQLPTRRHRAMRTLNSITLVPLVHPQRSNQRLGTFFYSLEPNEKKTISSVLTSLLYRPSSSSTNTGGPTPQYPCLYPGCTHQSSRPFDLMRHMKKHNPTPPEEKYDCPGKGCGRVGAHGFDRRDHMTEHLRNFHLWDIPKGTSAVPKNGSGSGGRKRSVR